MYAAQDVVGLQCDIVAGAGVYASLFTGVYQRVYGGGGATAERASIVEAALASWGRVGGEWCAGARKVGVSGWSDVWNASDRCRERVDSAVGGVTDKCETDDGGVSGHGVAGDEQVAAQHHGKRYVQNRRKKERAKLRRKLAGSWRSGACDVAEVASVSSGSPGSVHTVDTRTADELEAVNTLARRRVAENKVAERMAQLRLDSLNDERKTVALKKLEAVRLDQRVNAAKAKSEESFKKCSDSLKSLGSIGSAGELYMRHELFEKEKTDKKNEYLTKQLELAMTVIPGHVRQQIADLEPPVMPSKFEVFGDCPDSYDEDQREAYYADLAADEPIF